MGYANKILLMSVLVLIGSLVIHEYLPEQIMSLMKYPVIRDLTSVSHKYVRSLLSILSVTSIEKHSKEVKSSKHRMFTAEELKAYKGQQENKGIYIALMGRVYDVTKGERFYGPGGSYEFFSGRDGSRAYVSGEFTEEGLTDDITGLSSQDYLGLDDWAQFYNKDYIFKGLLIGRFYNEDGSPTPYNIETQKWIAESYAKKDDENQEKKLFPPCNSEWTPESGSRLYCTTKSGGVHRDWVGVPRRLFHPGRENERCGCVKNFGPPSHDPTRNPHLNRGDLDHPHVKEYPGCSDQKKDSCHRPN